MSPELLFKICNIFVLPGWLLLIFLPKWKWSAKFISAILIPFILASVYIYLILAYFWGAKGGFASLDQVTTLFDSPHLLLAGWVHYLAFDLFVGCWELRDSQKLNISHFLLIPCLILTFLFGPAGLFLYLILRYFISKKITID